MSSDERRWIWWYAAGLAVFTSLPYLAAALGPHPGWAFSGFVFGVDDGNSYLAKLRAGAMGAWLFKTPYTTFPQVGAPVFLPYLLLGKLVAFNPSHTALAVVYHLFRLSVVPLAVASTYRFAAIFLPSEAWRRWVTVLATAGGGLGWLVLALRPQTMAAGFPLSFISPETFGFLALYGLPHLVLARAMLLMGLADFVQARSGLRSFWRVGLWLLGVALVQPIDLAPAAVVLGGLSVAALGADRGRTGWWVAAWRELGVHLKCWLPALPVIAALGTSYLVDPYLRIWGQQNRIESPPVGYYLVAYALVLLPAAWGAWRSLSAKLGQERLLPLVWILGLPALVYAPVTVQRRLAEGAWVAWLVLAAVGLAGVRRRRRARLSLAILALSLPASLILIVGGLRTGLAPGQPAFLPTDTARALAQLDRVSKPNSVLLASTSVANAAPAWAYVKVPVGHGPESANYDAERAKVHAFFSGQMGAGRQEAYLASEGIDFIFYGPEERSLGIWQPADLPGLQLVIASGDVEIYHVNRLLAAGAGR